MNRISSLLSFLVVCILFFSSCEENTKSKANHEVTGTNDDQSHEPKGQEVFKPVFKVAENVYSFSTDGEYISMFIVTEEGVIVFETINSSHAKAMVAEIKKITDKPIKYAFHSHNHYDHANGGQIFLDAGATTIAHKEAYDWMLVNKGMDMAIPTEYWEGDFKKISLGGITVEMHYMGVCHGLGMTVFIIPGYNLAYIADLIAPNRVPFTILPDYDVNGWLGSMDKLLQMNFEKGIFSHNAHENPLAGGTKEDIKREKQFVLDLQQAFIAELQKGTNPMTIPKTIRLPKYKDMAHYDDWLELNTWGILTNMFMGSFVPTSQSHPQTESEPKN